MTFPCCMNLKQSLPSRPKACGAVMPVGQEASSTAVFVTAPYRMTAKAWRSTLLTRWGSFNEAGIQSITIIIPYGVWYREDGFCVRLNFSGRRHNRKGWLLGGGECDSFQRGPSRYERPAARKSDESFSESGSDPNRRQRQKQMHGGTEMQCP